MQKNELVAIRDWSREDDFNFIVATWLRGLRFGNDWFEMIPSDIYYANYHRVVESLLSNPAVSVKVACLKEDPIVILGYAVFSGPTIHWVHVKAPWRRIGIAKSLVPAVQTASHITDLGKEILKSHPEMSFNPFAI